MLSEDTTEAIDIYPIDVSDCTSAKPGLFLVRLSYEALNIVIGLHILLRSYAIISSKQCKYGPNHGLVSTLNVSAPLKPAPILI